MYKVKQKILILTLLGVSSPHAYSANLADSVKQCSTIKNGIKRLVCFDNLAKQVKQQNAPSDQTLVVQKPTNVAQPKQIAENNVSEVKDSEQSTQAIDDFGFDTSNESEQKTVLLDGKLIAVVESVIELPSKKIKVTLSNGQVWLQTSSEKRNLPKAGDTIEIKKGTFKSFLMKKQGTKATIRVKRLS